ncbi:acyl-CoA dehydrogenase family protein [Microtetraspora glauca]|uniref:Acyl-CoA dehydrogenase family protein n=1 Tax=Microtetraspora glauca TaxID=1996 RepID=A0ABV3GNM0_MICGL
MTTPPVSLLYTEVEEELRAAVRSLLADACPHSAVLARIESATPYDGDVWKALARDIGAAGLLVPEELGGAGASAREAAVVLEELGRAVAPVPFLTSAVLATHALLAARTAGGGEVADDLLERLASGEITAALAVSFAASPYRPAGGEVTFEPGDGSDGSDGSDGGGEVVVSGRVTGVAGADVADVLLVHARVPGMDASALIAVGTREQGVQITPVTSLDLTRPVAMVSLGSARGRVVARGEGPDGADLVASIVRDALAFGAGLLASEQLGLAEWCLTTTVEYVKERKQFARPVGSFQALKHRLADLWLEIGGARAAARNAAGALAAGDLPGGASGDSGASVAVAVAQAHCGDVAVHAAEECVQLHGGIGMTWEHPAHLYLKRAKADQIAFGTPGEHRNALARLVDVPAPLGEPISRT